MTTYSFVLKATDEMGRVATRAGEITVIEDPFFSFTKSILHLDSDFSDSAAARSWINEGSISIAAAPSLFGGAGALFGISGQALAAPASPDFKFEGADFTIEGFLYATSTGARGIFATQLTSSAAGIAVGIDSASGRLQLYNNGSVLTSDAGLVDLEVRLHFALVRNGDSLILYLNGSPVISTTTAVNISTDTFFFGAYFNRSFPWVGYLDELRITKGAARYTAAFAPPSAPFPNI